MFPTRSTVSIATSDRFFLARRFFCAVFLVTRLGALAQSNSKEDDTGRHEEVTVVTVNTASWETRDLPSIRIRLKLPPGYKQKQWAVVVGSPGPSATFRLGDFNQIDFAMENAQDANPEIAKNIPQENYIDYKEWRQPIGGHQWIVQTFQGGGVIFDEQGERLPYCVETITALDAKHLLRVSAALENQQRQQEVLAMLKTIEFH